MVFLAFYNLKKSFGNNQVLDDVSFYLEEGEIFGLVGKSGGGKSTILNILLGISKPDSGKILFGKNDVVKDVSYLKENVGFVSQRNSLFPELTLKENCLYFGKLYHVDKDKINKRFEDLSKVLELTDYADRKLSTYSGGMTKRANILVSLIHHPKILILDEPTVGLDSVLRENLWEYIRQLNKEEKVTIFLVTHLLNEVEDNCNHVGILKHGKIIALASIKDYKKSYPDKSFQEIFKEVMNCATI